MSRYLYIDFALTGLVAANVCLLLYSEAFRRRGYALAYGLTLGLGMLVKWTFVVFALPPLLVVLAGSPGLPRATLRALAPRAWQVRRLLLALLLAAGITALWFVPNVQATARLPLGYALVPLSLLFWTSALYFGLAPGRGGASAGTNLLAALCLGAAVAAGWYLTKINFVGTFWLNAYGKATGRSWGFLRYLDFLYREQLSPLYVVLLLAALAGLAWAAWRRRARPGVEVWALVAWAVVPFLVFSSRVSIVHSRYIMPLLPPLGLAIGLWLVRLRPRWLQAGLTGAVVLAALLQFGALSFDAMAGVGKELPGLANGLSIQLPASGRTDPGYAVVPDILAYVEAHRPDRRTRLGVLVNEGQVSSQHFVYLVYQAYPQIEIEELATLGRDPPVYPRLFSCDFVLTIDPPPYYARRPDATATLERLAANPDDAFHRAYLLAAEYPLPDDGRLLLYGRRFDGVLAGDAADYQALAGVLAERATEGDAIVVVPPEALYALAQAAPAPLPLYPLPAASGASVSAGDVERLDAVAAAVAAEAGRLWLVLGEAGGVDPVDPHGLLARRLQDAYYPAVHEWYGPIQLLLYGAPAGDGPPAAAGPSAATWQENIALTGYHFVDETVLPGRVLRLDLLWQAAAVPQGRYKVFLHLLDGEGQLVAQHDGEPAGGARPTDAWQAGEAVLDRHGLWLPAELPAGDYRLLLGLYLPDSGRRLPVCCPGGDAWHLATLRVEGGLVRVLPPETN